MIETLLGALAVLGASSAIPPLINGLGWFVPTAQLVAVIWLVGVGARLVRVPPAVAVVLQVVAVAMTLTATFTTGGTGGVIPNGSVAAEVGELFAGAWEQIRTTVSPAPSSTELTFLICLAVGATALIVDLLIAVCRAPALVALPLLCMYSVPASIDLTMLPWQAFAAPAMIYAILLTASRLYGQRLGSGAGTAQMVTGVGLAAIATVIALVVADSMTGVGTAGRLPRTSAGAHSGIGLSPFTSLRGNLQQSDPIELLRVTGVDQPRYLRTVGLQKWTDGQGWSVDQLTDGALPDAPLTGDQTSITVAAVSYRDEFLPIYDGTTAVSGAGPGWSYDAALESVHRSDAVAPDPYRLNVAFALHTADQLRADSVTPGGTLTDSGQLPAEVVTLADQITGGATTPFDKAEALRAYFTTPTNGFIYSLTVPVGSSGDPLVDFLNNKQGYCEQYASAMAVMLRAVGVPARVAVGFTQGTKAADGSYVISSNDAHAWVEVLFNKAGWVQFDPTPLGGGQGGQQGFIDTGPGAATTAATPTAVTTTAPADIDEPTLRSGAGLPGATTNQAQQANDEPAIPVGLWWALAVLALTACAATGPSVVRGRRRRNRLAAADAGGPGAATAAWREIEDLAIDHDIGLNPTESARTVANRVAKAAHLTEHQRAELRAVVTEAERDWYGGDLGAGPGAGLGAGPGVADTSERAASRDGQDRLDRLDRTASGQPTSAAMTVLTARPTAAALGAAPRSIDRELRRNAPLTFMDRLVPRSVRPTLWRDWR